MSFSDVQILILGFAGIVFGAVVWLIMCAVWKMDPLSPIDILLSRDNKKSVEMLTPPEKKQIRLNFPSRGYSKVIKAVVISKKDAKTGKDVLRFKDIDDNISQFEVVCDPKLFHISDPIRFFSGRHIVPEITLDDEDSYVRLQNEKDDLALQLKAFRLKQTELMEDEKIRMQKMNEMQREAKRTMYGSSYQPNQPFGLSRYSRPWNSSYSRGGYENEGEEAI